VRTEIVKLLPRLQRLAWVLARHPSDSEDLVQRTVERVLQQGIYTAPIDRFDLWMFRIMKNLWIDQVRQRNRWKGVVEPIPDDNDIGDGGAMADDVLDQAELARLKNMVENLPEDQRLAIKLVLLGGHSYAEAAAILEIAEGTLTSRLARGRAALLKRYSEVGTRH